MALTWAAVQQSVSQYNGAPYVWGGNGPGFDCSGLVVATFHNLGISLPRTAQEQFDATPRTSTPAPGDLVFYGTSPSDITHVAIYAGNGQMWSADHPGDTVRLQSVWPTPIGYGDMYGMTGSTATLTSSIGSDLGNLGAGIANPLGPFNPLSPFQGSGGGGGASIAGTLFDPKVIFKGALIAAGAAAVLLGIWITFRGGGDGGARTSSTPVASPRSRTDDDEDQADDEGAEAAGGEDAAVESAL